MKKVFKPILILFSILTAVLVLLPASIPAKSQGFPVTMILSPTPNPSRQGQNVLLHIHFTQPVSDGTIFVYEDGNYIGEMDVHQPDIVFSFKPSTFGLHQMEIIYDYSSVYDPTSTAYTQIVNIGQNTTTSIASNLNPSQYGRSVSFTATVIPSNATGTVDFFDNTTLLFTGVILDGHAVCTTNSLTAANHTISARYNGDVVYNPSNGIINQSVNRVIPVMQLYSDQNPSVYGMSVVFTAKLPQDATGVVRFTMDGMADTPLPIVGGIAKYTVSGLSAQPHTILAEYLGDQNYIPTAQRMTQTVDPSATSMELTASLNPSQYKQSVTFTATVLPGTATGFINFFDGSDQLGTVPVTNGSAAITTDALKGGMHSIRAQFISQPPNYKTVETTIPYTVTKAPVSMRLYTTPSPTEYGERVVLDVGIQEEDATGRIVFYDGDNVIGDFPVINRGAVMDTSKLTPGLHNLKAVYSGDNNYKEETVTGTHTVQRAIPTMTFTSNPNPGTFGNPVTYTVQFAETEPFPTGTVDLFENGSIVASGQLVNGVITFRFANQQTGSYEMRARYNGDSFYSDISRTLHQDIVRCPTTLTITSSSNPSIYGETITFRAAVLPAIPDMLVTFSDNTTTLTAKTDVTGVATVSINTLAVGKHIWTARFDGNLQYEPSQATLEQTVNKNPTSLTLISSNDHSAFGESVTFTAKVTPITASGVVSFYDGSKKLADVSLSNGSANYTTGELKVGFHTIRAVYNGDSIHETSLAKIDQTVVKKSVAVKLTSSKNPCVIGESVSFSADLAEPLATGKVTFYDGTNELGTANISGSKAVFSASALAVGTHSIKAQYSGDENYGSADATLTQTVYAIYKVQYKDFLFCNTIAPDKTGSGALGQKVTETAPRISGYARIGTTSTTITLKADSNTITFRYASIWEVVVINILVFISLVIVIILGYLLFFIIMFLFILIGNLIGLLFFRRRNR